MLADGLSIWGGYRSKRENPGRLEQGLTAAFGLRGHTEVM